MNYWVSARWITMCTTGESRLSSLAVMHIRYDLPDDLEEIVTLFGILHPRTFSLWIPMTGRIERVPLTKSQKNFSLSFHSLFLLVSLRYHFIERNAKNTHENRRVKYKSELICIYICQEFFFIHTSRIITLSSVRALKWNVFWNTCILAPSFSFSSWQCSVRIWLSISKRTLLLKLQLRARILW